MTNKTKAAIEEAAKLPTAEETLQTIYERNHKTVIDARIIPNKFPSAYRETAIAAIESHTAAHTAGLRDQIADLERENNNYRIVYDSVVKNRDELRERVKELEDNRKSECIAFANWLSNQVLRGRSIDKLWRDYEKEVLK